MNKFLIGVAAVALLATSAASAQPYDHAGGDRGQQGDNGRHAGWGAERGGTQHWQRGQQMGYNDWNGAQPVDYRQHHLRAPPRGYEWRESNGQYVLAAVATGLIASIILSKRPLTHRPRWARLSWPQTKTPPTIRSAAFAYSAEARDQAAALGRLRRATRKAPPRPKTPTSISAQVAGSGTEPTERLSIALSRFPPVGLG